MRKKSISLIVIISLLFISNTFAQVPHVSITLGPQIGYQKAADADNGKLMYGVALRIHGLPLIGVEGSINYRQESYLNDEVTVKSIPVMVSGLLYVLPIVYGEVGFGWYNTKFDFSSKINDLGIADETQQKVGWHFGAGVELPLGLSSNNYITADIKYVFLNYDFKTIPGTGDTNANFYVISAGIQFGL